MFSGEASRIVGQKRALRSLHRAAKVGKPRIDMDHAAAVSLQFRASVSQADDVGETPSAGLALAEDVTDEVLLAHIARGTQEALAVLFRRYARCIRNIGSKILRDAGEADDLVQDVFLYVFRKGTLYDPSKGPGRSWVIQVAYTQAYLRRRALQSHGFYERGVTEGSAEADPAFFRGVHHDYTVEGFFGRNGWKSIWNTLTECQRETLRLHFYEGCTLTEIAEKLGQSYVNIRHHYYRGLEKLRKHANENDLNWP